MSFSYTQISVFCAKYLKAAECSFAVMTEQSGKYFAVAAALMYSCFWEEPHNSLKPILISLTFKEHSSCVSGKNSNINVYLFFVIYPKNLHWFWENDTMQKFSVTSSGYIA